MKLVLLAAFLALPAMAGDCPKPKPLNCDQIKSLAARRGCETCQKGDPGPQGPQGPQGVPGPKGDKGDPGTTSIIAVPTTPTVPREKARPLVGGGVSFGEGGSLGWHLFGGVQFPPMKSGGIWQLQIGGAFERRESKDYTCPIGCRTCNVHVDGGTDERAVISGVYVF